MLILVLTPELSKGSCFGAEFGLWYNCITNIDNNNPKSIAKNTYKDGDNNSYNPDNPGKTNSYNNT